MPSSIVVTLITRQQALMLAQLRQARYGHLLTLQALLLLHHGYSPRGVRKLKHVPFDPRVRFITPPSHRDFAATK